MPFLGRTGRLDVARLDERPAADLHEIHAVLAAGLRDVEVHLQLVERSYYADADVAAAAVAPSRADPAEAEAARWAAAIRPMLSAAGLMAFLSLDQVNDAAHRRDMDADVVLQLQQQQMKQQHSRAPSSTTMRSRRSASGSGLAVTAAPAAAAAAECARSNGRVEEADGEVDEETDDRPANGDDRTDAFAADNATPAAAAAAAATSPADGDDTPPRAETPVNGDNEDEQADDANVRPSTTAVVSAAPAAAASVSVGPAASTTSVPGDPSADDPLFALSRTLRECVRKVLDAVPHSFDDVLADVRRIERHLTKYCISFYEEFGASVDGGVSDHQRHHKQQNGHQSAAPSSLLGTASTYDRQIRLRRRAVDAHLSSIGDLVDRFRTGELRLADLGSLGADLARRAGAAHAPFLLLFPCACRRIRSAVDEMRSWLADDAAYAEFVANDVDELESRARAAEARLRAAREEFHRAAFRARAADDECRRIEAELEKTRGREDALVVDEELLAGETGELKAEAETNEYRLAEVRWMVVVCLSSAKVEQRNSNRSWVRKLFSAISLDWSYCLVLYFGHS